MWIARNKDNKLILFRDKPSRKKHYPEWYCAFDGDFIYLDSNLYPEVTWDTEPLEVEVNVTLDIK